ncbi:hypothetical protein B0T22DRAFT_238087 [Podospora appendiculata]|uniref:Uncharacterized protein n=1 Tax=Podospora appendiculata TaxID=314037 RepID=A0AAE0X6U1_9PEZI|nr:hypothetical protein B0T22DRAFT_238087 [Podospora appendiculata]
MAYTVPLCVSHLHFRYRRRRRGETYVNGPFIRLISISAQPPPPPPFLRQFACHECKPGAPYTARNCQPRREQRRQPGGMAASPLCLSALLRYLGTYLGTRDTAVHYFPVGGALNSRLSSNNLSATRHGSDDLAGRIICPPHDHVRAPLMSSMPEDTKGKFSLVFHGCPLWAITPKSDPRPPNKHTVVLTLVIK